MSKTESTMVKAGHNRAAIRACADVISGRGMSRDDIFASAGDEARGLLVMFICVHCPYVKHVEAELAKISEDYEGLDRYGRDSKQRHRWPILTTVPLE